MSVSENGFAKIYGLKNDTKKFPIKYETNFNNFVSNRLEMFVFFFKSKISKSVHE
jgi:hypothetical protein